MFDQNILFVKINEKLWKIETKYKYLLNASTSNLKLQAYKP